MKVETTLPLQKEARILQFTKDVSLASFQWCLLRIAHNYPFWQKETEKNIRENENVTHYLQNGAKQTFLSQSVYKW